MFIYTLISSKQAASKQGGKASKPSKHSKQAQQASTASKISKQAQAQPAQQAHQAALPPQQVIVQRAFRKQVR